jgi:hypothetical protein
VITYNVDSYTTGLCLVITYNVDSYTTGLYLVITYNSSVAVYIICYR